MRHFKIIEIADVIIEKLAENNMSDQTVFNLDLNLDDIGFNMQDITKEMNTFLLNMIRNIPVEDFYLEKVLGVAQFFNLKPNRNIINDLKNRVNILIKSATEERYTGNRFFNEYVKSGGMPQRFYGEKIKKPLPPQSKEFKMKKNIDLIESIVNKKIPPENNILVKKAKEMIQQKLYSQEPI